MVVLFKNVGELPSRGELSLSKISIANPFMLQFFYINAIINRV